ncbi:unnamed protein product [Leuciscus chuanchicus]
MAEWQRSEKECPLVVNLGTPAVSVAVSQWSPAFVQELPVVAEKTALLYHLSYLCLANFPNLERIIRSRAVETRLLFGSSDATMLKCILTSDNLVKSLFPMLMTAVEKNKPILAVKFLEKAQVWITDIITDVAKIVERYDLHNKDVGSSTSDVIQEKIDTDKKITEQNQEVKLLEEALSDMKSEFQKTTAELAETEKKINSKSQEIQEFARSISKTSKGLGIFAAIVPFIGLLVKSIYDAVKDPEHTAQLKALEAELNILIADKTALKQKQWQVQLQIMDQQMKAARASFDQNSIPDPVYLPEVQKKLSKIQEILIQLKEFWASVGVLLASLKQTTFAGESCQRVSVMFKLQNKDAYKFLEVSPSSLSKEQWQIEYESVKEKLEKIDPPQSVSSSVTPAITE